MSHLNCGAKWTIRNRMLRVMLIDFLPLINLSGAFNSLGGTIILLTLFAQRYIFGQKYTEGNILHCMKQTWNKTRIAQWRLLNCMCNINFYPFSYLKHVVCRYFFNINPMKKKYYDYTWSMLYSSKKIGNQIWEKVQE